LFIKNFFEKIWQGGYGDLMEKQAKSLQETKFKLSSRNFENKDKKVILNDKMLKFHENDRRKKYQQQWLENCKKYVV